MSRFCKINNIRLEINGNPSFLDQFLENKTSFHLLNEYFL